MNIEIEGIGVVHSASIMNGLERAELEEKINSISLDEWVEMGVFQRDTIAEKEGIPIYPQSFLIARNLYVNLVCCTVMEKRPTFSEFIDAELYPEVRVVEWYNAARELNPHWWTDESAVSEKKRKRQTKHTIGSEG
jgi:hypothetical protein